MTKDTEKHSLREFGILPPKFFLAHPSLPGVTQKLSPKLHAVLVTLGTPENFDFFFQPLRTCEFLLNLANFLNISGQSFSDTALSPPAVIQNVF